MIRVVLDTNIVVSAHLVSGGLPDQIFSLALNRWMELCVSPLVMAEYEEVLRRPRLDLDPGKVATALARIRDVSVIVSPTQSVARSARMLTITYFSNVPRQPRRTTWSQEIAVIFLPAGRTRGL